MSLAHRTGTAKAGPITARLVPCGKSKWHRHHPENESCGECPPPSNRYFPPITVTIVPDWYIHAPTGVVYDANKFPDVRTYPEYLALGNVIPYTVEAKRLCGCSRGGSCIKYNHKMFGFDIYLHEHPPAFQSADFVRVP